MIARILKYFRQRKALRDLAARCERNKAFQQMSREDQRAMRRIERGMRLG